MIGLFRSGDILSLIILAEVVYIPKILDDLYNVQHYIVDGKQQRENGAE